MNVSQLKSGCFIPDLKPYLLRIAFQEIQSLGGYFGNLVAPLNTSMSLFLEWIMEVRIALLISFCDLMRLQEFDLLNKSFGLEAY